MGLALCFQDTQDLSLSGWKDHAPKTRPTCCRRSACFKRRGCCRSPAGCRRPWEAARGNTDTWRTGILCPELLMFDHPGRNFVPSPGINSYILQLQGKTTPMRWPILPSTCPLHLFLPWDLDRGFPSVTIGPQPFPKGITRLDSETHT